MPRRAAPALTVMTWAVNAFAPSARVAWPDRVPTVGRFIEAGRADVVALQAADVDAVVAHAPSYEAVPAAEALPATGEGVCAVLRRKRCPWQVSIRYDVTPLTVSLARRDASAAAEQQLSMAVFDLDGRPFACGGLIGTHDPASTERTAPDVRAPAVARASLLDYLARSRVDVVVGNTGMLTHETPRAPWNDAWWLCGRQEAHAVTTHPTLTNFASDVAPEVLNAAPQRQRTTRCLVNTACKLQPSEVAVLRAWLPSDTPGAAGVAGGVAAAPHLPLIVRLH